jgi:hypothetical protein
VAGPALEVTGARQLRRALKDAGVSVQDLKDAHKAVAEDVARASAPRAPRRTGALAASVRPSGTQAGALVRAGNGRTVPYAAPVHWGWPARNITAQPWIYRTAEDRQPQWEDQYLRALEAIIRTVEGSTP